MRARPRLYPYEPLQQASRLSGKQLRLSVRAGGQVIHQARTQGLTLAQADRWTQRLGLEFYDVWPDADIYDGGEPPVEQGVLCASWGCTERFIPRRQGGSKRWPPRFCSEGCRRRDKNRRARGWTPPAPSVCASCGDSYQPTLGRPAQRFCSSRCRQREKQRRYRQQEAVRARRRTEAQRYRAEVRDIIERRRDRREAAA